MKKKTFTQILALLLVFVMAFCLTACGGDKKSDDEGTKLSVGLYGGLDSLNPWSSGRITKDMVTYVLYETLACCQSGSTEIDYILMKSYEKLDDLTYSFEIYDYIKDAEGNPVKASDVVFSFTEYCKNWGNTMDTIKATGDYTCEIKLTTTAAGAFEYLACKVPIATEKAYNASPDQFASTACGTMPYTVAGGDDYVNGTSITLRKTGEYWQTDESLIYEGSKSYVDVIEFLILAETTQLALAVKNGDVQVAFYINNSMLDEVAGYEGIEIVPMPSTEDRGFQFCMTEDSIFYDNLALRQAVLYAIDNEAVAEAVGYGYAEGSKVMFGSADATVGYNPEWEISPYEYNPEKARELLKESGYNGETLRMLCNTNAFVTGLWTTVQANLAEVGINAEMNVAEGTSYGAYRNGTSGQYELCYAGPGNGGYATSDLLNTLFNRNNYESGATFAGLVDDDLQALYDKLAAPGGYTQENLDAIYDYVVDNALYYQVVYMPDYAAYNEAEVTGYFMDWNRFIRANTIQLAD